MKRISAETDFFLLLLHQYAQHKRTTADKVLKRWEKLGIVQLIQDMYWRYHSEALENAFDDIDAIIAEKRNAATAK